MKAIIAIVTAGAIVVVIAGVYTWALIFADDTPPDTIFGDDEPRR